MEQHRVLLIIVSVAVVLAAIIGGGIWLLYPRDGEDGGLAASLGQGADGQSSGFEWEPRDYLLGVGETPGLDDEGTPDEATDVFTQTYGTVTEDGEIEVEAPSVETRGADGTTTTATQTHPDRLLTVREETSQSSSAGTGATGAVADSSRGGTSATSTDATSAGAGAAGTPAVKTTGTTAGASEAAPGASASASSSGSAASRTAASGVSSAVPSSGAGSVATSTGSPRTPAAGESVALADQAYWVQVLSSPNRDTAEQAQQTLREHQLGSRVVTRDISGTTYYRVRLGPFAVRAEAEKFLGWVVDIDDFSDAMIFVDYTTAVAAAPSGS